MATKYEIEQLAAQIKERHTANLETLQAKFNDCNDLLHLYRNATPAKREQFSERQFLLNCRKELANMIREEQNAINEAYFKAAAQLGQF